MWWKLYIHTLHIQGDYSLQSGHTGGGGGSTVHSAAPTGSTSSTDSVGSDPRVARPPGVLRQAHRSVSRSPEVLPHLIDER
jgi:hypothetical protein